MLARPSVNIQPRWLGAEAWLDTKPQIHGKDTMGVKAGQASKEPQATPVKSPRT